GLGQRSAEDREVLREREHLTAVDQTVARDHAVARNDLALHAEVAAAVGDQLVDFLERARIEEELDALARGQLSRGVLPLEPFPAAAELGATLQIGEGVERIGHG